MLIEKKLCNCLVPEAEVDVSLLAGMNKHVPGYQGAVEDTLNGVRAKYGGLWVGGEAELTTETLTFRPNLANALMHEGNYTIGVRLADIVRVDYERAFLTGIVHIRTRHGSFKLRCFGARRFGDRIMQAHATVAR